MNRTSWGHVLVLVLVGACSGSAEEMGGLLHTRSYDGSRWGGWTYCAHIDYS